MPAAATGLQELRGAATATASAAETATVALATAYYDLLLGQPPGTQQALLADPGMRAILDIPAGFTVQGRRGKLLRPTSSGSGDAHCKLRTLAEAR